MPTAPCSLSPSASHANEVTVPVTHQLTDRSGEIPPNLLRNEDGTFPYPDVICVTEHQHPYREAAETFADWHNKRLTAHDEEVIQQLQGRENRPPTKQTKLCRASDEAEEAIKAGASWDTINMRWKYPKVPQINATRLKQGEKAVEREGPKVAPGEINFFGN